jgi:glycerol-3-phosphate responsive antiterminator
MKSHHTSNLCVDTVEGIEKETKSLEFINDVKEQAAKVALPDKAEDRIMEDLINGVLTTRDMVRLIATSTKSKSS